MTPGHGIRGRWNAAEARRAWLPFLHFADIPAHAPSGNARTSSTTLSSSFSYSEMAVSRVMSSGDALSAARHRCPGSISERLRHRAGTSRPGGRGAPARRSRARGPGDDSPQSDFRPLPAVELPECLWLWFFRAVRIQGHRAHWQHAICPRRSLGMASSPLDQR